MCGQLILLHVYREPLTVQCAPPSANVLVPYIPTYDGNYIKLLAGVPTVHISVDNIFNPEVRIWFTEFTIFEVLARLSLKYELNLKCINVLMRKSYNVFVHLQLTSFFSILRYQINYLKCLF